MDAFDRREEGFEKAFAHQEDLQFRARAHRNRKIGAWAGEKLGLADGALDEYAAAFAARYVTAPDDEALVAELAQALAKRDVAADRIRRRLGQFGREALAELHARR